MNISSLSYIFDQLHTFLSEISIIFDVIGITEVQVIIKVSIFIQMNISSLSYNSDHLHTFLSEINISFDLIGITETRLKKQTLRTTNIDIIGYNLEHTPTEASCGGLLLYVKKN